MSKPVILRQGKSFLKKFIWFILIISVVGNLLALGILDRTLFYRDKIAAEESAFFNQGLRITRSALIRQADYPQLGILLGGNVIRYWYLPSDEATPLANFGGMEEKAEETYTKLKQLVTEMSPRFVIINVGFCQIHTAVYAERDVEAAITGNLDYLRQMVDVASGYDVIPILSSLAPVRATHFLPFTGLFERSSAKKDTENKAIREYNTLVKRLAGERGLPFLDFHAVLVNVEGQLQKSYALTDGEHLNQAGYQALNTFLNGQLVKLLAEGTI